MWSVGAVVFSGLVTIVAVVLGYLYTTGRWRWTKVDTVPQHLGEQTSSPAASPSDVSETSKMTVAGDRWPIGSQIFNEFVGFIFKF